MKSFSLVNPRIAAVAACGVALALGALAPSARADEWSKRTTLTTNQTIQIRDKVLPPGSYVLRLLDSESSRNIVQIYNGDQTKYIGTVLAIPAYRMEPTGTTQFTFWETPPGMAKALRTWYYPGDNFGQEFPYPSHLVALTASTSTATTTTTTENNTAAAAPTPVPPPVVEPPAQPEQQPNTAMNEENQTETEQQPATPSPTPAPVPENNEANRSTEMPTTASPYPMIGAFGLLSLLLFAGLRWKRSGNL